MTVVVSAARKKNKEVILSLSSFFQDALKSLKEDSLFMEDGRTVLDACPVLNTEKHLVNVSVT